MSCAVANRLIEKTVLRIPMRGYEIVSCGVYNSIWQSYESPCGVMSVADVDGKEAVAELRIPMRGYEPCLQRLATDLQMVTNPHAGL